MRRVLLALVIVVLAASTAALRSGRLAPPPDAPRAARELSVGGEPVRLDPAGFATRVAHPYWPMRPGTRWVYLATGAGDDPRRIVVTVTGRTERILGIHATVVHDVLLEEGEVEEDTYDWYAQDLAGNVWYLGEDTRKLEDGKVVSTEGSWRAGVDGALPGILLPADPAPGLAYRQEYDGAEAQDTAAVLTLNQRARVPSGMFDQVLITKEFSPLEPRLLEHDFYALGVGAGAVADRVGRRRPGGTGQLPAGAVSPVRRLANRR